MEPHHTVPGGGNEPRGTFAFLRPPPAHDSMQTNDPFSLPQSNGLLYPPPSQHLAQTRNSSLFPPSDLQPDHVNGPDIHAEAWQTSTVHQVPQSESTSSDGHAYYTLAEWSHSSFDNGGRLQHQDHRPYPYTAENWNPPHIQARLVERLSTANDSTNTLPHQRKTRCLKCKTGDGHRGCFNYPICDCCIAEFPDSINQNVLLDQTFLKWQDWYSICKELGYNHNYNWGASGQSTDALLGMTYDSVNDSSISESINNIILEFGFDDRIQSGIQSTHHTVIIRPQEQIEMRCFAEQQVNDPVRAPVIDLTQLDGFVRKGVWGETLWNFHEEKRLNPSEKVLWYKVRLLIGYVSMNHNLATTSIQSAGYMPQEMQRRVAAELVYSIGWRLQMLWFEISQMCLPLVSNGETANRPVVTFYALEILYRLLSSMRQSNWRVPDQSPLRALTALQNNFNARVEHVLGQICTFECVASGRSRSGRKFNHAPNLLSFARSLGNTPFPSHCHLTAYRHRDLPFLTLVAWDRSSKRRLVDVLGFQPDAEGSDTAANSPDSYLDDHNEAYTMADLLPSLMISGAMVADARTEGPRARKKNDGRPVVARASEVTSGMSDDDMTTLKAQHGTPQETPTPSLTHESSPMHMTSPATPITPADTT